MHTLSVIQGFAVGKFNRMLKQAVVSLWLCLNILGNALQLMQFCENKYMLKSMTPVSENLHDIFDVHINQLGYCIWFMKYGYLGFYTHIFT